MIAFDFFLSTGPPKREDMFADPPGAEFHPERSLSNEIASCLCRQDNRRLSVDSIGLPPPDRYCSKACRELREQPVFNFAKEVC